MNEWIDLSVLIEEDYLVYPGDSKIQIDPFKTIKKDGFNMKTASVNMHVGTHMDFKSHMLETDEKSEDFPIGKLIGKANVVKPAVIDNVIQTKDIIDQYEKAPYQAKILLVNTNHADKINTEKYYNQPKFEAKLFAFLKAKKINVLGVDLPTVVYHDSKEMLQMHWDLLGNDITIIENLTNMNSLSILVEFIALPLKIRDIDGSLLRAVAKNINFG